MKKVIVIGGGPAGMIAAGVSASLGNDVTLIEKNDRLGRKLAITGKGRCNITNASDLDTIMDNIVTNKKFMYTPLYSFSNDQVIDFFESRGVKTKVERGNRVFPVSDDAKEVVRCLEGYMQEHGVAVYKNCEVTKLFIKDGVVKGLKTKDGQKLEADHVIVATGGKSYPGTGSTGDGYRFGESAGHSIVSIQPALVPLVTKEDYVTDLQGLSLRNVRVTMSLGKKEIYDAFGEMLFTHFGITGPVILSASSLIKKHLGKEIKVSIDLKPKLNEKTLDARLLKDFDKYKNKDFKNGLDDLLPKKMIPIMIKRSGIDPLKKIHAITKEERLKLLKLFKEFDFTVTGSRSIKEGIVTAGGINIKEIDPYTMESKLVKGLSFVGEVLDIDALTGGYNLQVAFSTGYLAGISIS